MHQRKNFENQLIFNEDMDKSKVARFYGPRCSISHLLWGRPSKSIYVKKLISLKLCVRTMWWY